VQAQAQQKEKKTTALPPRVLSLLGCLLPRFVPPLFFLWKMALCWRARILSLAGAYQ
jgi:hypothetical protein